MSQTKIVVIPLKKLLIGAVIAAIVIAFVISLLSVLAARILIIPETLLSPGAAL